MRNDLFERKVIEIMEAFVREKMDCEELEKGFDIGDEIWSDKETFGAMAYEIIVEHYGDEFLQEVAEKQYEELKDDEEEDEEEEDEE